jgi:hypothetical protein
MMKIRTAHAVFPPHSQKSSGSARMVLALTLGMAIASVLTGCAHAQRQAGTGGAQHTHRSQQPPEKAARCFARNAEEHSSALMSEVTLHDNRAEVVVRVKNGVTYAMADFRRSGAGSAGTIVLMVITSGRRSDLLDSLTKGC